MHADAAIKLEGDATVDGYSRSGIGSRPTQYKSTLAGMIGQLNPDLNSRQRSEKHTPSDHLVGHRSRHLLMNVEAAC
jgi:hypothetical protein